MRTNHCFSLPWALSLVLTGLCFSLSAQNLETARELSFSGKHQEAEAIYRQLLNSTSGDQDILLGAAYNHAWMGKFDEAQREFGQVLTSDADNLEALIGIGYTYAWNRNYEKARTTFDRIIQLSPADLEARKGIAYTYLWEDRGKKAILLFGELIGDHPETEEFHIAQGVAYSQEKEFKKAEEAFQRARELAPDSEEAARLLAGVRSQGGKWIVDIWSGFSWLGTNEARFGLRGLQLSVQLTKRWRAFLKYDNSLSQDILALVQAGRNASAVSGGALYEWNKNLMTEVEFGWRFLPDNVSQQIIHGSQIIFLPASFRLKVGAFAGFSPDIETEWMIYGGLNIPFLPTFYVEPAYYFIQPAYASSPEQRIQLGLRYRALSGYELAVSGLYGKGNNELPEARDNLFAWSVSGLAPISRTLWGQAAFRKEKGILYDFSTFAVGLKLHLR